MMMMMMMMMIVMMMMSGCMDSDHGDEWMHG